MKIHTGAGDGAVGLRHGVGVHRLGVLFVEFFQHRFLPAVGPDGFLAGKHFLHEAVQGPQLAAALAEQRPHPSRQPAG